MKLRCLSIALFFLAFGQMSFGQLTTSADFKRMVYEYGYSGGVSLSSSGYALNGRYFKYVDGYNLRGFTLDLARLRHPKEVSTQSDQINNYRGFVVGRMNAFFTARMGYFWERIVFDKTDRGTISINWVNSGGLSLGLLKPIHLVVEETGPDNTFRLRTRRYEGGPFPARVRGEANFFVGIDQLKVHPGVYYKTGMNFDLQKRDDRITALEGGIMLDYYFKEVPIFYEEPGTDVNWNLFFQFYVSFNYGTKKID
jgi:hypothetical protein